MCYYLRRLGPPDVLTTMNVLTAKFKLCQYFGRKILNVSGDQVKFSKYFGWQDFNFLMLLIKFLTLNEKIHRKFAST